MKILLSSDSIDNNGCTSREPSWETDIERRTREMREREREREKERESSWSYRARCAIYALNFGLNWKEYYGVSVSALFIFEIS
jgi:hypothetical protein